MIEGTLTQASEHDPNPHLQLGEHVIHSGSFLEVYLDPYWVNGRVELADLTGNQGGTIKRWILDTGANDEALVLLRVGIRARFDEAWLRP